MAKASPLIRSFNGGETSPLVEGRTDLERYPSSCRTLLNVVAAPQGPAIPRSGTAFVNVAYDITKKSVLIPFVFSETEAYMLEFAHQRVRFFTEDGLLVKTPVSMTITDDAPFLKFTSAALTADGAAVGSEVAFVNFPDDYNMNGVVAKITAKSGDDYTVNIPLTQPTLYVGASVALVYHVVSPYTEDQLDSIRDLQSLDVVYLVSSMSKPYKLLRSNTYDWAFVEYQTIDGPYLPVNETSTKLTPASTGNANPVMTSNTAPSGVCTGSGNRAAIASGGSFLGRTLTYALAQSQFWYAFDDGSLSTYWAGDAAQTGTIEYDPATPFACDGFTIYMALENQDTSYTAKDYAPSAFSFDGWNGSAWITLHREEEYVLYDNNKSVFFELKNTTAYSKYRLVIDKLTRNGPIEPRVKNLVMRSTTSTSITINASATTGINNDQGFLASDVGRLIRMQGSEGTWRSLKITARNSATQVVATLLGEPFINLSAISEWRLGYWSETTGWPNALAFYQDRLWMGGSTLFPDLLVASAVGDYENMAQTTPEGEVLDESAIVVRLNSRKLSRLRWIAESNKALLVGTGSQEFVITTAEGSDKPVTAGNIKATGSSRRGSADADVVPIDNQALYIPRAGRIIREFAYVYEADGYKSPSMSMLASHLGSSPFVKMVYAAEPYSIVWMQRTDGTVVGLTYNRDENVVGWHRHDFSGGIIESMAVIPAKDQLQDTLWLVVRRTVDGVVQRYIERLTRFWDFDMGIDDAQFVDCGLRYEGSPIKDVYGLTHLEGRDDIYGVADGLAVGPFTVQNGMISLSSAASNIVLGIGFESEGETTRLENGSQDGTAQGKEKRINKISVNVWSSYGGELGTWNEDIGEVEWVPLEYPQNADELETISLFTGILGPITPAVGYEKRGSLFFRRTKDKPFPFNLTAIMPQLNTQDG